MKDPKNDSTPVLERFGRDKRKRTVVATAERVERRPRLQRDAADSEQPSFENRPERRASYNPHFTADNRPVFEKPHYGDKSRGEGDRPGRIRHGPAGCISIHALREEGDQLRPASMRRCCSYFYPRPPRGGRLEQASSLMML